MQGCIPTYSRLKKRTFDSPGFPAEGTLIPASVVPHCGGLVKQENGNIIIFSSCIVGSSYLSDKAIA